MAAVAPPASIVNGSHETEKDTQADHSPSRFTAVNGKEVSGNAVPGLTPALGPVNGKDAHREGADVGWSASGYSTPPQQDAERLHDRPTTGLEQDDRNSHRSSSQVASLGATNNKRKRSESIEQQASPPDLQAGQGVQRSPGYHHEESSELHGQSSATNGAIQEHSTQSPIRYQRVGSPEDPRGSTSTAGWHDYDSQLISQAQKAQNLDASDAQLAEALQREAQGTDSGESRTWGPATRSVETPEESDQHSFPSYGQDRSQATVQVGPKRKRVFSNRTKTGCMTCRRRKKKCDEQHPACKSPLRAFLSYRWPRPRRRLI